MLRIAIVEDSQKELDLLQSCLDEYRVSRTVKMEYEVFGDAETFLERYTANYDIVFMDIELPGINGMEAAQRLREIDQKVVLIFVTNMAQFAVRGYEVDALDYVIKPVKYGPLCPKLDRAVARCRNTVQSVVLNQAAGSLRLLLREILYIEVRGHRLTYHTEQGEFECSGTLQDTEEKLHAWGFLRCNKCYLVNQRQIREVQGGELLLMNGERLQISRLRKKEFLEEFAAFVGSERML